MLCSLSLFLAILKHSVPCWVSYLKADRNLRGQRTSPKLEADAKHSVAANSTAWGGTPPQRKIGGHPNQSSYIYIICHAPITGQRFRRPMGPLVGRRSTALAADPLGSQGASAQGDSAQEAVLASGRRGPASSSPKPPMHRSSSGHQTTQSAAGF